MAPEHQATQPDSRMRAIAVAVDPAMGRVPTPAGPVIEVRRIYGLTPEEMDLAEPWSCAGVNCSSPSTRCPRFAK